MDRRHSLTGQAALLEWCKRRVVAYDGVKVENFDLSWRNGLAFVALIHSFAPQRLSWDELQQAQPSQRLEAAFQVAEALGVPALLTSSDLLLGAQPEPFSVMTYLSQVYHRFASNGTGGHKDGKARPPPPRPSGKRNPAVSKEPLPSTTTPPAVVPSAGTSTQQDSASDDDSYDFGITTVDYGVISDSEEADKEEDDEREEEEGARQGSPPPTTGGSKTAPKLPRPKGGAKAVPLPALPSPGGGGKRLPPVAPSTKATPPRPAPPPPPHSSTRAAGPVKRKPPALPRPTPPASQQKKKKKPAVPPPPTRSADKDPTLPKVPPGPRLGKPLPGMGVASPVPHARPVHVAAAPSMAVLPPSGASDASASPSKPRPLPQPKREPPTSPEPVRAPSRAKRKPLPVVTKAPSESGAETQPLRQESRRDVLQRQYESLLEESQKRPLTPSAEPTMGNLVWGDGSQGKKDGWLMKENPGGVLQYHGWKRRWFAIRGGQLMYWKEKPVAASSADVPSPLGYINLASVDCCEPVEDRREHVFTLSTPERLWRLQASDEAECIDWVQTLRKRIRRVQHDSREQGVSILTQAPPTSTMLQQDSVRKEGALEKRTRFGNFQLRYFVLQDGHLYRYKAQGGRLLGKTAMYGCHFEEYEPDVYAGLAFSISPERGPQKDALIVKAYTQEDMMSWINAMLRWRICVERSVNSIVVDFDSDVRQDEQIHDDGVHDDTTGDDGGADGDDDDVGGGSDSRDGATNGITSGNDE